jgi:hypothetical protein
MQVIDHDTQKLVGHLADISSEVHRCMSDS